MYMKLIEGSNDQESFLKFMQELTHKLKGEAILIMDNLTVHHSRLLQDFFEENKRITLKYLPAYTSVLNPIERVWNVIKHQWRNLLI